MALNGHRQPLQSQRLQIPNGPRQSGENRDWDAVVSKRFQRTPSDNMHARTARIDHVVSELLSAAHDIVQRHRLTAAEYDAVKASLTQAGDGERPSMLDVVVEHTVVMDRDCS